MEMKKPLNRKILLIILIVIIIVAIFHIPAAWVYGDGGVVCLHKKLLGIGCPLCGMTRAVYELVHWNFAVSLQQNFNIIPFTLLLMCWMIYYIFPSPIMHKAGIVMLIISAAGFIVVYALRIAGLY
jgi:hypothetical protein